MYAPTTNPSKRGCGCNKSKLSKVVTPIEQVSIPPIDTFQGLFYVALSSSDSSSATCDKLTSAYVKSADFSFLQRLYTMNKDKVDKSSDLQDIFNCVDSDILPLRKICWIKWIAYLIILILIVWIISYIVSKWRYNQKITENYNYKRAPITENYRMSPRMSSSPRMSLRSIRTPIYTRHQEIGEE